MTMYIGAVAKLTGASLKAIRHYEALGLLGKVPRSGAYRCYTANELLLIQLIKQAQGLGFRLAELAQVLAGHTGAPDWLALAAAIEAKQLSVRAEIARLQALEVKLQQVHREIISCLAGSAARPTASPACALTPPSVGHLNA
ncbi:MAG: MerR family transcriptional regulator [Pseudomonas sp.]|nr:MerR family transcriptional regulator [Pseudomonas sp.]